MTEDGAFQASAEIYYRTDHKTISHQGILASIKNFPLTISSNLPGCNTMAYLTIYGLLEEIYEEVASGNEIRS